ncbi:MAG: hypothetical protein LH624_03530, partial [Cryobacterium sp.]|nr:hypothetical protein [Cryobacterium sp.]
CTSRSSEIPEGEAPSQAELEEIAKDILNDQMSQSELMSPGIVFPDVSLVRKVSPAEFALTNAECIQALGFDADVDVSGNLTMGPIADAQLNAREVARFTCAVQYPIDPMYYIPLNDAQVSYLYDYFKNDLTRCITDHGYQVNDPPSRQTFVSNYADNGGGWSPFDVVPAMSEADWAALNLECKQIPEGLSPTG